MNHETAEKKNRRKKVTQVKLHIRTNMHVTPRNGPKNEEEAEEVVLEENKELNTKMFFFLCYFFAA